MIKIFINNWVMKKSSKKTLIFKCMFCLLCLQVNAQQNTMAAGGNTAGSGGSLSFSVGQIDFVSSTGTGGTALQGVQQPYEVNVSFVKNLKASLSVHVFPNPVTDILNIRFSDPQLIGMYYKIYSMDAKCIAESKITSAETAIEFQEMRNGIYFLKVYSALNEELKEYKIIKNK